MSSRKDHPNENGDCWTVISIGISFGISVNNKLSTTTQISFSQNMGRTLVYQYTKTKCFVFNHSKVIIGGGSVIKCYKHPWYSYKQPEVTMMSADC